MIDEAAEEARFFYALEHGYRLVFARSGFVFDFEDGTEPVEHDTGSSSIGSAPTSFLTRRRGRLPRR